jgi:hypothetical protein
MFFKKISADDQTLNYLKAPTQHHLWSLYAPYDARGS